MEVTYLEHTGSDLTVVNAARVSFGKRKEVFDARDARLIKYLVTHGHVLPFRHPHISFHVKAPLIVARQLGKHQVGMCLSGDTPITFVKVSNGTSNGIREVSIADLYRMWSGQIKYQGGAKGRRNVSAAHVRVYNEESQRFETSHIVDVLYSGKKDLYDVTTADGLSVKASADHKFLTTEGWKTLQQLNVGDFLVSDRAGTSYAQNVTPRGVDRSMRRKFALSVGQVCVRCKATDVYLEVDHILPVWSHPELACDSTNMQMLCGPCHYKKSSTEKPCKTNLLPKATEIVEIEYAGQEDTYDLSIDRIHNFVAGGVVVHNSWSELSRRYVTTGVEFYWPEEWRAAAPDKKQGSLDGAVDGSDFYLDEAKFYTQQQRILYERLIANGVAPEQARMVLPQNMYTEWHWTGSLLAWAHVWKLRAAPDTQKETRDCVLQIGPTMERLFPVSWKELTDAKAD